MRKVSLLTLLFLLLTVQSSLLPAYGQNTQTPSSSFIGKLNSEPTRCTEGQVYYNLALNSYRFCSTDSAWTDAGNNSLSAVTRAGLPAAAAGQSQLAVVTANGEEGGLYQSNGSEWIKITDKQNLYRFEGYSVILNAPTNQTSPVSTQRYGSPIVVVSDLDSSTPHRITPCNGSVKTAVSSTATQIQADYAVLRWCFYAEDPKILINFKDAEGNSYSNIWVYDNLRERGFVNVTDFGATPNDAIDDTLAIQSALKFVASKNGGRVSFPEGEFLVGGAGFTGLVVPPNVVIEGAAAGLTGGTNGTYPNKGATRIKLTTANSAVFRIGEAITQVVIRDLELSAPPALPNTYGIEAVGRYYTSLGFTINNVVFTEFARGIYSHALAEGNWQNDFWKIENCTFNLNREAGIYVDAANSDWSVTGSSFYQREIPVNRGDGIYFRRGGFLTVRSSFGGGANRSGGDFVEVVDCAGVTIENSQSEGNSTFLRYGDVPGAGSLSEPITLKGNLIERIQIRARANITSIGNQYVDSVYLSPGVQWQSFGDRFCYDVYTSGCTPPPAAASVNAANDTFTAPNNRFEGGARVQLTSSSALPAPLSPNTDYFIIRTDPNSFKLATSFDNMDARTAINLTTAGTSNVLVTRVVPTVVGGTIIFQSGQPEDKNNADVVPGRNAVIAQPLEIGTSGQKIVSVAGSPESSVIAPPGSIALRSSGGAGTSFYVKESGTGNVGWRALPLSGKVGAVVASAPTITLTGNVQHITGTAAINNISTTNLIAGMTITLIFDSTAQAIDNTGNLRLAGNLTGGAGRTLTLIYDGNVFFEISRSTT